MGETRWEVARGANIWSAWAGLPESGRVGMSGSDVLDGALVSGFKAEWLAASAGVTPLLQVGGAKVIPSIGHALVNPARPWPCEASRTIYLWNQRCISALHASVTARQRGTRILVPGTGAPKFVSSGLKVQDAGIELGVIPALPVAAWIVIGVLGVASTMAVAWYASRVTEKSIDVDNQAARATHAVGSLADLASAQLTATGKLDPSLVNAIANLGKSPASPRDDTWAWVAGAGVGGLALGAIGSYMAKGRR